MKPKKKNKADLEKFRFIFFEIGVLITLAIVLAAFSWSTVPEENDEVFVTAEIFTVTEKIINTKREEPEPLEKAKIPEIINVVKDDNLVIDELDFSTEIDPGASFFIPEVSDFGDDEEFDEIIDIYVVEDKPLFNGGDPVTEFPKFIYGKIDYPDEAVEHGIEGRVTLSFIIDEQGRITNIQVLASPHNVLSEEALRVVNLSPPWTPGKQRGKPVKVRFTFPVVFDLR